MCIYTYANIHTDTPHRYVPRNLTGAYRYTYIHTYTHTYIHIDTPYRYVPRNLTGAYRYTYIHTYIHTHTHTYIHIDTPYRYVPRSRTGAYLGLIAIEREGERGGAGKGRGGERGVRETIYSLNH